MGTAFPCGSLNVTMRPSGTCSKRRDGAGLTRSWCSVKAEILPRDVRGWACPSSLSCCSGLLDRYQQQKHEPSRIGDVCCHPEFRILCPVSFGTLFVSPSVFSLDGRGTGLSLVSVK